MLPTLALVLCAVASADVAAGQGEVLDRSSPDAGTEPTTAIVAPRVAVTISGALVQPPAVYLAQLQLPATARLDQATADAVRDQLEQFLFRGGYALATVETRVTPDGIAAEIDEGKIDRIIFPGRLSFQQLRFRLALTLPYDVFNRDSLDRQVRALGEELGTPGVRWVLVRTAAVVHEGPQVKHLPSEIDLEVTGGTVAHDRRPYEVRITFPDATGNAVGVDLRAYYVDGLELGLNYLGHDLIADGDLWSAAGSVGVGARQRIGTGDYYPYFSRAAAEARYATPKLFRHLRPGIWAATDIVNRQRPDLNLESYWAFTAAGALQLELDLRTGLRFALGAGYEARVLFAHEAPPGVDSPYVGTTDVRARPFIRLTSETVVHPRVLRWDRRHTIETESRLYFPFEAYPAFGWADVRYQFVKEIGWHDFWVKGRGHVAFGDVAFHDEISVGEFARGIATGAWVPMGVSVLLEFRFSLLRDTIKVGLFHDLALFGVPLRTQGKLAAELGNGFGPSLHLLLLDMFQLDMYLGFGFRRGAVFHAGFGLILNKAF